MPGSAGHVEPWTAVQSISFMDRFDIDAAILSVSAPGVELDTPAKSKALARACNEAQARIVTDHPKRFGMFGILPLPDIDATLREIEYCCDVLAADGLVVMSNYGGTYIGEKKFWPVFAELNRRRSVVLVHPTLPDHYRGFAGVSLSTLEFPFDTARAIVSMLHAGTPQEFPDFEVIWSHAGGAMPYLAGRTATLSRRNKEFRLSGDLLIEHMQGFHYDLTQSVSRPTFACLNALVPLERLLFGSDCPFAKEPQVQGALDEWSQLGLPEQDKEKIERSNALSLFPRLRDARNVQTS